MRVTRGILVASALALVMSPALAAGAQAAPEVPITWTPGPSAPAGATRWDGAVFEGSVYFLGFRAADNTTDGSIWAYDIAAQTYSDTGIDMAVPISNYSIATLEDANGTGLYTFGGRTASGETSTVVQVFYPATGVTQVLDSDPWPGTTLTGCTSLAATGVTTYKNKRAYVLGGTSFSTSIPPCADDSSDQVWRFRPNAPAGERWSQMASLNQARGYIAPAVIGKRIYAVGGDVNSAGSLVAQPTVERWKIGAAAWNDAGVADLPVGCDETQAFGFQRGPLAKTVTVAGCGQWPSAIADVMQYDTAADTWTVVGALNEARRNHAGANIGTSAAPVLAVFGGYNADGSATLATSEFGTPGGAGNRTLTPAAAPAVDGSRLPVS